jgi:Flp pilus assembly protein TadB
VINASRVHERGLTERSTSGKAEQVSILQERKRLRALSAFEEEDRRVARLARYAGEWMSRLAGNAMPLGATLALVWLATVGLVVINYLVPFNLVSLIYMLPVVVAATQWGLGLGIVAAVAGAAAAGFLLLSAALHLLDQRSARRRRSRPVSVDRRSYKQSRGPAQE